MNQSVLNRAGAAEQTLSVVTTVVSSVTEQDMEIVVESVKETMTEMVEYATGQEKVGDIERFRKRKGKIQTELLGSI